MRAHDILLALSAAFGAVTAPSEAFAEPSPPTPGRNISPLPAGKTVDNTCLHYRSEWNREGQSVTVRREITVRVSVAVSRDEIRAKLAEAIAEIRGDYRSAITLAPLVH